MKRYFMYLSYNGTNYNGWQTQPNGTTIQQTIEDALSVILRVSTPIVGAGRTDAKVHARTMVAHFDSEIKELDVHNLTDRLNGYLPNDIAIKKIEQVKNDAHARFDATYRLYRYYVVTEKDPFRQDSHFRMRGELDLEAMNKCANALFDYTDFTSFSKLHTDVKTNNCKIMQASWLKNGSEYIFTIKADRFLRNMVRAIVGTLIDVGKGKLNETDFRQIIEEQNRCSAGISVPGHALYLEEVGYNADIKDIQK
ncbi:tRNA pseudouridine(38-40) synthase TruA [Dysgonomonas sp. 216]|uniref:tRNA pseudouridine(38-40) synthase TruA n=1 Tax=Dysgonomonas sp. 216 TaxID=2302934 RepID=UPI0013CFC8B8|nr:tRNA pseudouridine(38-40) synthase TruA [Dysgonomonas sp. 216]NDW17364.1 tRNA pseudouridine(38-40) synthase TruA [Dysgonomonas sp. 216]